MFTYTRSHNATKPSIAAKVASPRTIIPSVNIAFSFESLHQTWKQQCVADCEPEEGAGDAQEHDREQELHEFSVESGA